jgi:chaperonin GroES
MMSDNNGMGATELVRPEFAEVYRKEPTLGAMLAEAAPEPLRKTAVEFVPLRDWVLVRICSRDEMSEGGLVWLPTTAQERPDEGIVLARGQGEFDALGRLWPTQLSVGDHVVFGRYAGDEIVMHGKKCRKLREKEIQGIIR